MICYKNTTTVGGDPTAQSTLKSLVDLTKRLFLAVYKERGWRYPFIDLELEFMELTGETPSLEDNRQIKLNIALKHSLVKEMEAAQKIIADENGWQEMADGFNQAIDVVKRHFDVTSTRLRL